MKKVTLLIGAAVLFAATIAVFPQKAAGNGSNQLSPREAVELIRSINTAEADLFFTRHSYAPLKIILNHRFLRAGLLHPVGIDSTSATIKNYKLLLMDSSDGKHYVLDLVNPKPDCQLAFFSNDAGVIYTAEAIGCPKQ